MSEEIDYDAIVSRIKQTTQARLKAINQRGEKLRFAVDAYQGAAKKAVRDEIYEALGIRPSEALSDAVLTSKVLADLVHALPEVIGPGATLELASEEDDALLEEHFPTICSNSKPVVMIGGTVDDGKLATLIQTYGVDIVWIATDAGQGGTSTPKIASALLQIGNGQYTACIVLHGLISHDSYSKVVTACRTSGIPVASGERAGTGAVKRALNAIEHALKAGAKP